MTNRLREAKGFRVMARVKNHGTKLDKREIGGLAGIKGLESPK